MKSLHVSSNVEKPHLRNLSRTSLVVRWLRIRLPMQGMWVRYLVWENLICLRATKPSAPQLLSPPDPFPRGRSPHMHPPLEGRQVNLQLWTM